MWVRYPYPRITPALEQEPALEVVADPEQEQVPALEQAREQIRAAAQGPAPVQVLEPARALEQAPEQIREAAADPARAQVLEPAQVLEQAPEPELVRALEAAPEAGQVPPPAR